jgi:hypothetical protein
MVKTATHGRLSIERKIWCRLSVCGCEFMIVAFCSAKEAKIHASLFRAKGDFKKPHDVILQLQNTDPRSSV